MTTHTPLASVGMFIVAAFRPGGSMAVLYPVYAGTFIWAALIGWWAYGTPIRLAQIAGMLLLVLGMYLMGRVK